jgi:hypothetical protein
MFLVCFSSFLVLELSCSFIATFFLLILYQALLFHVKTVANAQISASTISAAPARPVMRASSVSRKRTSVLPTPVRTAPLVLMRFYPFLVCVVLVFLVLCVKPTSTNALPILACTAALASMASIPSFVLVFLESQVGFCCLSLGCLFFSRFCTSFC